jgi:hypothetical protein
MAEWMELLRELEALRRDGLITDQEFEAERVKIIPSATGQTSAEEVLKPFSSMDTNPFSKSNSADTSSSDTKKRIKPLELGVYQRPTYVWVCFAFGMLPPVSYIVSRDMQVHVVADLLNFLFSALIWFGIPELVARRNWRMRK